MKSYCVRPAAFSEPLILIRYVHRVTERFDVHEVPWLRQTAT
jgi:hypothetical protein